MVQVTTKSERRTSVDEIYDLLHEEIATLLLKPGDRISEADIATRFGVSRQPVRDAFSRLANQGFLLIRPQRATEVRRFSLREIEKARFVRTAIEKEVLCRASERCDAAGAARLTEALAAQDEAMAEGDYKKFTELDYDFHEILCEVADADYAFEVILSEKAKVDRLCRLGLAHEQRMPDLIGDHRAMAEAVIDGQTTAAVEAGVTHLSRLDETIIRLSQINADYFDKT